MDKQITFKQVIHICERLEINELSTLLQMQRRFPDFNVYEYEDGGCYYTIVFAPSITDAAQFIHDWEVDMYGEDALSLEHIHTCISSV